MTPGPLETQFFTRYKFEKDFSRPGRTLQTVKVGDVYISRLGLDPSKVIGNIYYEKTNIIFFVERGRIRLHCKQINTGEDKETVVNPGDAVVHLPPYTAFSLENMENDETIIMFFSNKPLRSGEHDHPVTSQDVVDL